MPTNLYYLIGGVCIGWLVTMISVVLALAFCRAAAMSDPDSDYYKGG